MNKANIIIESNKMQETNEEPTQPTRFFKHIETISGDNHLPSPPIHTKKISKLLELNNHSLHQPQLPKISRRRIATEVSINQKSQRNLKEERNERSEKEKLARQGHMSINRLKESAPRAIRNTKSRSSFYSVDTKGKKYEFKVKTVKTPEEIEEYTFHLRKLEQLYQLISLLMMGVYQANPSLIKQCLNKYMTFMEEKRYEFLDHFIKELSPKGQRTLNISRIQEYMSVLYISERVLMKTLQPREDTLVNMSGFCAGNIIFLAKLFMLLRNSAQENPFEQSIKHYQITNFGVELTNYDDIITRIQHNNQTIKITQVRIGKGDFELHNKLKDFIKMAAMEKFTPSHSFYYLFEYFAYYLHLNSQLGAIQCLETCPAPYLPYEKQHSYTVVIQPVGVLVCQKKYKLTMRPHCLEFLNYLRSKNCQIVLWTQLMPGNVKQIMRLIDHQKQITHKLYRYHCTQQQGVLIKDLRRLGRDMDKTLILDYSGESFITTPRNGIQVPWNRSVRDKTLLDLIQIVSFIMKNESPVQLSLQEYRKEVTLLNSKSKPALNSIRKK